MFGQLGEMASLMKKYGEMQTKMKQMKEELAEMKITGSGAGGLIKITIQGDLSCVDEVEIDPRCCDTRNQLALQGAVREALNDALEKVRIEGTKRLNDVTGGIKLPGMGM